MIKKKELINHLHVILDKRLLEIQQQIESVSQTASQETKSSMGDKYETGRAMAHLELDKLERQKSESQKNLLTLQEAERLNPKGTIGLGSLVKTSAGVFFIACGLGRITINTSPIFVISLASPVGRLLQGKQPGHQFQINNKHVEILEIS